MDSGRLALRLDEVSKSLGVCPRTVFEWTKQKLIPHLKIGKVVLYPTDQLREWLAAQCGGVDECGVTTDVVATTVGVTEKRGQTSRIALLETLRQFPQGATARTLREKAGVSGQRFTELIRSLIAEGIVEPCTVVKWNRRYTGYRLRQPESQQATD